MPDKKTERKEPTWLDEQELLRKADRAEASAAMLDATGGFGIPFEGAINDQVRLLREVGSLLRQLRNAVVERDITRAEVEMLRGVGCGDGGDGPCGVCMQCLRAEIQRLRSKKTKES